MHSVYMAHQFLQDAPAAGVTERKVFSVYRALELAQRINCDVLTLLDCCIRASPSKLRTWHA